MPGPTLLDLPLEIWPDDAIPTLPKGISRHLVRFVHLGGYVLAVKETSSELAKREYELLRTLQRLDIPGFAPVAVITDHVSADGEESCRSARPRAVPERPRCIQPKVVDAGATTPAGCCV